MAALTTRRSLSTSAQDRLRRYVLLGVAVTASALGGSLRCEGVHERESFVLELPRIAPCALAAS